MDIDVGKIDRIQIWHDNTGTGSAWFLDSVTVRKNSSMVSNIYIQRLEHISHVLYRQNSKLIDHHDDHGSRESLGNNRSILRSPIMSDRISLQKKVTWDEQSIGSQDDFISNDSQRLKKNKHAVGITDHFEHQAYWISSHSFTNNNQWQIKSIEETNSFDIDQSTRALLLSDRSMVKSSDDEIYDFQANRWLATDKDDGKTEIFLIPKSVSSSNENISKSKSIERSPHLFNSSKMSTRPNVILSQHDEPLKNTLPIDMRSKSFRDSRHRLDTINSEHELLSRIVGDPLLSTKQPTKSLQHKKDSLGQLTGNDKLSTRITSESLTPRMTSSRNSTNMLINTSTRERDSLNKLPLQPVHPQQQQQQQPQIRNSLSKSSPRLTTIASEPSIKSKSFVRSNPFLSTDKSISSMFDQSYYPNFFLSLLYFFSLDRTYKSAYDIQSTDDF